MNTCINVCGGKSGGLFRGKIRRGKGSQGVITGGGDTQNAVSFAYKNL